MNDSKLTNIYEDRINTNDTYFEKSFDHHGSLQQNYKALQFKHRTLEHEYAVLQNQFQLYSSQTFGKINSLQKDMDMLVEQKDIEIKTIGLQNKNLKQQNTRLQAQIIGLQSQLDKLTRKYKSCESQLKNNTFTNQRNQMKQRQILMNFQRELSIKIEQVQNLKDILNNQRMAVMSKDQILMNKDNQISELIAELKSLSIELDSQREIQDSIKQSNHRLKREVQDLKLMFAQMEAELRNCQKCQSLELKNMQLVALLKSHKERQRLQQRQNYRKDYSYSLSHTNKRTIDYNRSGRQNFNNSNRLSFGGKKYLTDLTVDDIRPTNDFAPSRTMKDSVVRRCRIALDKN